MIVGQRDEAMVRDGHTMSAAAEILQHVLGSAEGWFGVDDPIFAKERAQPGSEELGMGEWCEFSAQVQLAVFEGRLQGGDELARNTRRSTAMGRKKRGRDRIQQA
jgi:hypothetical protein